MMDGKRNYSTINSAATSKKVSLPTENKLESTLDTLVDRQMQAIDDAGDSKVDDTIAAKPGNDNSV